MNPADITLPTGSLSLEEAVAIEVRRCEVRSVCKDPGAVLRLTASLEAGACCCCRGIHTDLDLQLLCVGPS